MDEFRMRQRTKQMLKVRHQLIKKVRKEFASFIAYGERVGVPREVTLSVLVPHKHALNSAEVGTVDEIMDYIAEQVDE